jgi:hypothetical protein
MASEADDPYSDLLQALDEVGTKIAELEEMPKSPKRETALRLLREQQSAAFGRLRELTSDSNRN